MEKHESRLTFEEDKPKESKLTYDKDLAKQAAGKAEHASRLQFDQEEASGGSPGKQRAKRTSAGRKAGQASALRQRRRSGRSDTVRSVTGSVRMEVGQANEDENAGVEGVMEGESLAESSVYAVRDFAQSHKVNAYGYANKLTNDSGGIGRDLQQQTNPNGYEGGGGSASRQVQKEEIKKEYAVAKGGYASTGAAGSATGTAAGAASGSAATAGHAEEAVKDTASATEKAAEEGTSIVESLVTFVKNHAFLICCVIVIAALILIISGIVTSCASGVAEAGGTIGATSYLADDDDILQVEEAYCSLEQTLQSQIDRVESSRSGYDEYKYEIDEIGHNPFELAAYLTVRYGAYKLDSDVSSVLQSLFNLQYQVSYTEETETRYRENEDTGEEESYEYRILTVTVKNNGLSYAISQMGISDDEREYYQVLMSTYGNRPDIFGDGYYNAYYVEGDSYQVPGEALTDERFARMLAEAEKYLGYPYVWGGSSPSTSFDCSGFVSWVINHCGNGWSVGRQTANGLKNLCTTVSPAEAQPGDLIFFQGTYNTSGASHVGIYVGNGMMIHCGNPIKYSSINTSYWQSHFLCFGRLPAT